VSAFAACGSSLHHLAVVLQYHRGRFERAWLEKLHTRILFAAYGATFVLGLLAYPTYRYRVRALYFDREAPWLTNLFDIKEAWAAAGLPLAIALFALGFVLDPRRDRDLLPFYTFLSGTLALIVGFNLVVGLLVVSYRSI
jgi:hypothetical protein